MACILDPTVPIPAYVKEAFVSNETGENSTILPIAQYECFLFLMIWLLPSGYLNYF